jgi:hypothetical protein
MLGSPIARTTVTQPQDYAVLLGWGLAAAFGLAALYWLWRWRDAALFDRALPWFVLGGYGALACAAAALGRSFTNRWTYALISHYATLPSYLVLAVTVLTALFAADLHRRLPPARTAARAALERGPAFLAGLLLASQVGAWLTGIAGMQGWREARLEGRAALLFLEHFEPGTTSLVRLDGVPEVLHRLARRLDDAGFLHPPLLDDLRLSNFEIDSSPLGPDDARIERSGVDERELWVRGLAWLPEGGRRADAVLITFRDAAGERQVAGLAETRGFPRLFVPEADQLFNEVRRPAVDDFAPFSGSVELARLPAASELELEAWALDSERMRVRRFAQGMRLRRDGRVRLEVDPLPAKADAEE